MSDKIIQLTDVSLSWSQRSILENINLTINKSDFVAITGPNGGGKTTLLRVILKLLKPTTGQVAYYYNGTEAERLHIGYLPQKNMIDNKFPITVEQVVKSGLIAETSLTKELQATRIDEIIELVELNQRRNYAIGQLSGGQLQRTLLGRALISKPEILILDEPLSYIDKQFESKIYDIIDHLSHSTTIILVSHEMSRIASMANRHIIVDRTIEECTASHHYFTLDCPCPSHPHSH